VKTLTVKVPEVLDARLSALARRRRVKRSAIVRRALARYLSQGDAGDAGSFLELAGDLAGCVSGPRDLSVGERHMRGYGR
jgi:predicted transcriptional regulator